MVRKIPDWFGESVESFEEKTIFLFTMRRFTLAIVISSLGLSSASLPPDKVETYNPTSQLPRKKFALVASLTCA